MIIWCWGALLLSTSCTSKIQLYCMTMTHHLWHEKSAIGSDSGLNNLNIFNRDTHQEISEIFLVGVSVSKLVVQAVPSRRKHQQSSLRIRSAHRLFRFLAELRGCAEVVDEMESTIVCRHVMYMICIDQSHCIICSMHGVLIIHDICLCQSSQTIKFRPGQKATARAASNDIDRPKPDLQWTTTCLFVVQTYQIQCMEPWKAMTLHLLELLSKVSESHSTPVPQEQHPLEEGFLREVDRRV